MMQELFNASYRLDGWLSAKFGRPYRALLSVGLAIEIVQHIREFPHVIDSSRGVVLKILALLLFAALLLHQLGEMRKRVPAHRDHRRSPS
jgi:hypothetical protein